jgi:hypothetical protein
MSAQPISQVSDRELLEPDQILMSLSMRLTNARDNQLAFRIERTRKAICEKAGFDYSSLALWDETAGEFIVEQSWTAGNPSHRNITFRNLPWITSAILAKKVTQSISPTFRRNQK